MNRKPEKIGLFGGTFDPVHNGHLILAREAMEQLGLDLVLFLPANISPHKQHSPPTPASDRVEVLRAAIRNEPGFVLSEIDVQRKGASFSIDTVRQVRADYPKAELFFFIGADNVAELQTWKEWELLQRLVCFVVMGRGQDVPEHDFPTIERRVDISSTEIRNRIARGQSVRYLLPEMSHQEILRRKMYGC